MTRKKTLKRKAASEKHICLARNNGKTTVQYPLSHFHFYSFYNLFQQSSSVIHSSSSSTAVNPVQVEFSPATKFLLPIFHSTWLLLNLSFSFNIWLNSIPEKEKKRSSENFYYYFLLGSLLTNSLLSLKWHWRASALSHFVDVFLFFSWHLLIIRSSLITWSRSKITTTLGTNFTHSEKKCFRKTTTKNHLRINLIK